MSDKYTVTTRQSWGSRLGNSIKGIGIGLLLFIVGCPVLWWNEGRAVTTAKALKEGASAVVSVPSDSVNPANDGDLVHTTGMALTDETLSDPDFPQVQAKALGLKRDVEIFQWQQETQTKEKKNVGGSTEKETTYSYKKVWASSLIDSSGFHQPAGHENPSVVLYASFAMNASDATLGAFSLPQNLIEQVPVSEPLPVPAPPAETGTEEAAASDAPRVTGGQFYLGDDPNNPAIGDVRIKYFHAPEQEVSVIARQQGNTFAGYQTSGGKRTLLMLKTGSHSADEMFAAAQSANRTLTWVLRVVGYLMMLVGLRLVLGPVGVLGDVVPFFGNILRMGTGLISLAVSGVCAFIVVGMAWIYYRPLLGVVFLLLAAVIVVAVFMAARKRAKVPAAA